MSGVLDERIALVTGGSRGIGQAICIELAHAGANVVFTYKSSPDGARETEKRIEEDAGSCRAVRCDVADGDAVDALVADVVKQEGRVDILVNNAGITRDQVIMRMKPEDFDAVIATNLRGTWNLCRAASRPMLRARAVASSTSRRSSRKWETPASRATRPARAASRPSPARSRASSAAEGSR